MIGRTIDRYEIVGEIGRGGMGTVWRARDPLLGRDLAIKFLTDELGGSAEARERFLREARAACALSHPGIATVFDAGEEDGKAFIAFEYIDGETVAERVKRGPLPVTEALRLAREAAEALGHAHDQGILHRDITSRNLMIDRQGKVKVVDFGLALPEGETRITRTGSALGTVGYMAPEMARGEPGDRRSDLYELGVVLYEMLTGGLPFTGERAEAVLYAVVHEAVEPPGRRRAGLGSAVDRVLLKALARNPDRRYQTAREFLADLVRLEGGEPVRAPARKLAPLLSRREVRIGIPVVAALGALLWWSLQSGPAGSFDSIAVLPLDNMSEFPQESEHMAEGLADAFATRLAKIADLKVSPWVSSRRYPPSALPLPDISRELNVDALLVGTFRKDGGGLKINVSLVDGETGMTSWAGEFKARGGDLLEIPQRIVRAVATRMKGELTAGEERVLARTPTTNAEAFDLYLQGALLMQVGDRKANDLALARFERAAGLDPALAEAHVGIGAVQVDRYFRGWGGQRSLEVAERSFRRALELDPTLIRAHQGLIRVFYERGDREECLKRGQEIRDSGDVRIESILAQAVAYMLGGLASEAVPLLQVVNRLDPVNQSGHFFLVITDAWSGRFQEAIRAGDAYFREFGEDPEIHLWVALAHYCAGDQNAVLPHIRRAIELSGSNANDYTHFYSGLVFQRLGRGEEAERIIRDGLAILESRLSANPDNLRHRLHLASLYSLLGDGERVRAEAERFLAQGGPPGDTIAEAFARVGDRERATELMLQCARVACFREQPLVLGSCLGYELEALPAFGAFQEKLRETDARLRSLYAGG